MSAAAVFSPDTRRLLALAAAVCCLSGGARAGEGDWTGWGGPTGDFVASSEGLAASWPEQGPPRLWSRELGEGYSGVLIDDGRAYTMFRRDDREVVIALDVATGETLWEHPYAARPRDGHVHRFGDGPRATPLIVGPRIYTVGVAGLMHCLDKASGARIWSRDLWREFEGTVLNHGYSSSPIARGDTVVVLVGGPGASIVALDQKTGETRWKAQDFENSYSTPRVASVAGKDHLLAFMATALVAVDPDTGALEWSWEHENRWRQNVHVPVLAGPHHLLLSSPQAGGRGLRLERDGERTGVAQVWSSTKIEFYHGSTARDGDWVYGSSGTMEPAWLTAVNVRSGEIGWREGGFPKANCLLADSRLLILDEEGWLTLATATPAGLRTHSRARILQPPAWTAPTVVGRTLVARDQHRIVAHDLGQAH